MATDTQPTKRQSSAVPPAGPKPQCKFHPSAVVGNNAQLIGPHLIEIGENAFIHPYAKIRAEHGNVIIGKGCIIAEKAVVGPSKRAGDAGCMLGDGVSIETGALVEARRVGDNSTVEINARLREDCIVGKWCKIGAMCEVGEDEVLEDFTVLFGDGERRVDTSTRDKDVVKKMRESGRRKEIELLKQLVADKKLEWTT